jgi:hypothetical protein
LHFTCFFSIFLRLMILVFIKVTRKSACWMLMDGMFGQIGFLSCSVTLKSNHEVHISGLKFVCSCNIWHMQKISWLYLYWLLFYHMLYGAKTTVHCLIQRYGYHRTLIYWWSYMSVLTRFSTLCPKVSTHP